MPVARYYFFERGNMNTEIWGKFDWRRLNSNSILRVCFCWIGLFEISGGSNLISFRVGGFWFVLLLLRLDPTNWVCSA